MGWEVDEVVPITCLLSNLGELLLRLLLCHAMLVEVDWVSEIHDRCGFVKLMVYLRWQLKHTSGWIEVPGYSRIACLGTWVDQDCLFYGPPPRLKGIIRLFMLETSVCSHMLLWALA